MATMQSLHITAYGNPSTYKLGPLPKPTLTAPNQVLIRVYASSINPIDWKMARGDMKLLVSETMPMKVGFDVSGVVEEVGSSVTKFKKGDLVMTRLPQEDKGSFSEYALTTESYIVPKPDNMSHVEAACIPLVGLTAWQAFDRAEGGRSSIKGKRVLVTGGLGGAAILGLQIAKKLGAAEVITTISTSKLARAKEELAGIVDTFIDYRTTDVLQAIEPKSLDFVYDTVGDALKLMPLLKPNTTIISIATLPPGSVMKEIMPSTPWLVAKGLDLASWRYYRAAKAANIHYDYLFMKPNGADLQSVVDLGVKGITGDVVDGFGADAEKNMQDAFESATKGGASRGGKIVVRMVPE